MLSARIVLWDEIDHDCECRSKKNLAERSMPRRSRSKRTVDLNRAFSQLQRQAAAASERLMGVN